VWETEGERFSVQHLWRVLRRMQLRLKKNRSMPPNRTRRRTASAAKRGGNK